MTLPRALAALALGLLLAPSAASQGGGASADEILAGLRPPKVVPARAFSWADPDPRGAVDLPLGTEGDWNYWPPVLQWRLIAGPTPDPVIEVIVYAPYSGSATMNERFKLQVPSAAVPVSEKALVIAFHSWGVSEQQMFNKGNGIAQACFEKGWYLLAPYGIVDVNMGNEPSQRAAEVAVALVTAFFDYDPDQIYTFGFSMGGVNATSFPWRHQDPKLPRVAGVIHHTGTVDVIRDYQEANLATKAILEDPLVFDGSPTTNPFAYERINSARFDALGLGFVDEETPLDSLLHVPFYLHINTNDPTKYDGWNQLLQTSMIAKGWNLFSTFTWTPTPTHHISTIDFTDAFAWIGQHELGPMPTSATLWGDRPGCWLYTELRNDPGGALARWEVATVPAANSFSVTETHRVDTLAVDLALMGLDAALPLTFTSASGDGTSDTVVLQGYAAAPVSILVNDVPPLAWSFDPAAGEVSITPNATGAAALVQVVP